MFAPGCDRFFAQAAARPDDLWCSDSLALSVYTSRKWLLEGHFRKCIVRQTFDAMKRASRAEFDLQYSNDTPMCKVVCGAKVDRAHVIGRFVTITSSICKDCF